MSCDLAVIGTNVPGIQGIIEHEINGLLVKRDAKSLRESCFRPYKRQKREDWPKTHAYMCEIPFD